MGNLPITKRTRSTIVAIIVGMMIVIAAILISGILNFNLVENLVMSWVLTTFYALIAFFLMDQTVQITPVRVVERPIYQEVIKEIQIPVENKVVEVVDRPIIKPIQIPMENRVVEVVDRPIIKPIQIPMENRVVEVVEKEHKKLSIPKFEFIGSTQTKTYHKRSCKFSRMLKNKYKLHSNNQEFFKGKHYKACKTCLKSSKQELHAKHLHELQYKKRIKNIKYRINDFKKESYAVCNEAQFEPQGYANTFLRKGSYKLSIA
ncbi:hypothetical protein A3K73_04310 [Candidatus Pacearchaeota archaeon RBG_13_36_9]|nr:MAG: hypothetical protein A3K73_04310 [Candidatus Pacearchaeota archaeon RBG_13_36_9]